MLAWAKPGAAHPQALENVENLENFEYLGGMAWYQPSLMMASSCLQTVLTCQTRQQTHVLHQKALESSIVTPSVQKPRSISPLAVHWT